jgi:DNA excision repair protein ERCC-3
LGVDPKDVEATLNKYTKYPIPRNVIDDVHELMGRFGKIEIFRYGEKLVLKSDDKILLRELMKHPLTSPFAEKMTDNGFVEVKTENRGVIKQAFMELGYPINDLAGYVDGDPYKMSMRPVSLDGQKFHLRQYQDYAVSAFLGSEKMPGGSGVVVLPCGAGKTVVGLEAMCRLSRKTLILVTNITAARQWRREILNRTSITEDEIGEYSGETKVIKPVTIATYQILTYRKSKKSPFLHLGIFSEQDWGLIVYDEVHLLPAPVFKFTADIQARRRLGLTATLIREDGLESDVFSLIGPKKFDVPWKDLEREGWIASARCVEVRVDMPQEEKLKYLSIPPRQQIRAAYENSNKVGVVREIIERHKNERILILGQYITQIELLGEEFDAPVIKGTTPNEERDVLYQKFRDGEINMLVLSRVGNMAIDLPDANIAIQVSGTFGSRQEEAQRLGRILRPKAHDEQAIFYSVVTRDSKELDFAMNRQLFLAEQGYPYEIEYR